MLSIASHLHMEGRNSMANLVEVIPFHSHAKKVLCFFVPLSGFFLFLLILPTFEQTWFWCLLLICGIIKYYQWIFPISASSQCSTTKQFKFLKCTVLMSLVGIVNVYDMISFNLFHTISKPQCYLFMCNRGNHRVLSHSITLRANVLNASTWSL